MAEEQIKSTSDLNKYAVVKVDSNIPIRLYFRSADLLIKQARVYRNEGDLEHAYILYMKYTTLGVVELPKHVSYKDPENKKALKTIKLNCLEALDALEQLQPLLDAEYKKRAAALENSQPVPEKKLDEETEQIAKTGESKKEEKIQVELDKLLKNEKTQIESPALKDEKSLEESPLQEPWSLQEALRGISGLGTQETPRQIDGSHENTSAKTQYPTNIIYNQSDKFSYVSKTIAKSPAPPLPPKPVLVPSDLVIAQPSSPSPPPVPSKIRITPIDQQNSRPFSAAPPVPPKVKLVEEEEIQEYSQATTEGGEPLRILNVPSMIQHRFLAIAEPNTRKNIETCGILCGKLRNNVLTVTKLIIPKQSGTSDTCTTENEEELFEYQDKNDLLTFGWIHTHPSQSCFLSSLDLHTHCSYQLMLPEAIAIVCAPKHNPSFGVFRLTDPPGLGLISDCKEKGTFHPHPDQPIYTDTHDDVGHVRMTNGDFEVVDLR